MSALRQCPTFVPAGEIAESRRSFRTRVNGRFRPIADVEPITDTRPMQVEGALLTLKDGPTVAVSSEQQLQDALRGLCSLEMGQVAVLERGPTDYIKAR